MNEESKHQELEKIVSSLALSLSQITHEIKAIRNDLVGSRDSINEGALPRINRKLTEQDEKIAQLEANGFTSAERGRILHVVSFFEGWKIVIAALVYLIPVVVFVLSILN